MSLLEKKGVAAAGLSTLNRGSELGMGSQEFSGGGVFGGFFLVSFLSEQTSL